MYDFDIEEFNHECRWLSARAAEFAKSNNIPKYDVPYRIEFVEAEIIPILNKYFKVGSKEWSNQLSRVQAQIHCELSFF